MDENQKLNTLDIKKIQAPDLSKSSYGKNIAEQFKHIDENFATLASAEFLVGPQGDSVENIEIDLGSNDPTGILGVKGETLTELTGKDFANLIRETVNKAHGGNENSISPSLSPITFTEHSVIKQVCWDDYLEDSRLVMICAKSNSNDQSLLKPITSMIFVVRDARYDVLYKVFENTKDNEYVENKYEQYETLEDASCAICYDSKTDSFVNFMSFPTLYYDKTVDNFCWRFNGNRTSLTATGPKGPKGDDGKSWIVAINPGITTEEQKLLWGPNMYKIIGVFKIGYNANQERTVCDFVPYEGVGGITQFEFGTDSVAMVFPVGDPIIYDEKNIIEGSKPSTWPILQENFDNHHTYWISPIKYYIDFLGKRTPLVCLKPELSVNSFQEQHGLFQLLRHIGPSAEKFHSASGLFVPEDNSVNYKYSSNAEQPAHALFAIKGNKLNYPSYENGYENPLSWYQQEKDENDTSRTKPWDTLLLTHTDDVLKGFNQELIKSQKDLIINYNTHFKGQQTTFTRDSNLLDNDNKQVLFIQYDKIGCKIPRFNKWEFNINAYDPDVKYNYLVGNNSEQLAKIVGATGKNGNVDYCYLGNFVDVKIKPGSQQPIIEVPSLIVKSNGRVGIKTINPETDLDVNGSVKISGSLTLGNNIGNSNNVFTHGSENEAKGESSHAEGEYTIAKGKASHTEGINTVVEETGKGSHAEGNKTIVHSQYSHAEGDQTYIFPDAHAAHAEGKQTKIFGEAGHVEGKKSHSVGIAAHAEGRNVIALGDYSHAEGGLDKNDNLISINITINSKSFSSIKKGNLQLSEGNIDGIPKDGDVIIYYNQYVQLKEDKEEWFLNKSLLLSPADSVSFEMNSQSGRTDFTIHATLCRSAASGLGSHIEGAHSTALGDYSHAEGKSSVSLGHYSHAEGNLVKTKGEASHAEGGHTTALGHYSHAEGRGSFAFGEASHSGGSNTTANGDCSHAEGNRSIANGNYSHAEGKNTVTASSGVGSAWVSFGEASHAEGYETEANGEASHAEGAYTKSLGHYSHAEGMHTKTNESIIDTDSPDKNKRYFAEHAEGQYNSPYSEFNDNEHSQYYSISTVGIGTSDVKRKNALSISNKGHIHVYALNGYNGANPTFENSLQGMLYNLAGRKYSTKEELNKLKENFELDINDSQESLSDMIGEIFNSSKNKAGGRYSHSEGYETEAEKEASHAEGKGTITGGSYSHAEGFGTMTIGEASHAEGKGTITNNEAEHACGRYNKSNKNTIFSIGVGSSEIDRKNAIEVTNDGKTITNELTSTNINSNNIKNTETITTKTLTNTETITTKTLNVKEDIVLEGGIKNKNNSWSIDNKGNLNTTGTVRIPGFLGAHLLKIHYMSGKGPYNIDKDWDYVVVQEMEGIKDVQVTMPSFENEEYVGKKIYMSGERDYTLICDRSKNGYAFRTMGDFLTKKKKLMIPKGQTIVLIYLGGYEWSVLTQIDLPEVI